MRYLQSSLVVLVLVGAATCRSPGKNGYQAPRKPGESVLSWADASSMASSDCLEGQLECNYAYLGTEEHRRAVASRAAVLYEYVALLDFDYDPTPVAMTEDQPARYTRLEVREVLEEFVNLLPEKKWDWMIVFGQCDSNGHCIMDEGGGPMPLWSGVNLVLGRVSCPRITDKRVGVYLEEVYAVEEGTLYDFFGFGYDWNEMREALKQAGEEAAKSRPEACQASDELPGETAPAPSDGSSSDEPVIIQPLPDPGQ